MSIFCFLVFNVVLFFLNFRIKYSFARFVSFVGVAFASIVFIVLYIFFCVNVLLNIVFNLFFVFVFVFCMLCL